MDFVPRLDPSREARNGITARPSQHLVGRLQLQGHALLNIQMITLATRLLGAVEISRDAYLKRLKTAVRMNCSFS